MLVITSFMCSLMSAHVLADNKAALIIISVCWHSAYRAQLTLLSPVPSPQGPCHVELQRALDKIAKSQQKLGDKLTRFYLPNCDKHGLYKPKQVGIFLQMCSESVYECVCWHFGDGFLTPLSVKQSRQVVCVRARSQDYVNHSFKMNVCVC